MNRFLSLCFLMFITACGGTTASSKSTEVEPSTIDCLSDDTQRALTFCASPQAADLAKRNFNANASMDVPVEGAPTIDADVPLVTMVVFTDLQCPYCKAAHDFTIKMMADPAVKVVFRHAPLPFHADAIPAAYGALAARDQGKFWEYVEVAFENQDALAKENLREYLSLIHI